MGGQAGGQRSQVHLSTQGLGKSLPDQDVSQEKSCLNVFWAGEGSGALRKGVPEGRSPGIPGRGAQAGAQAGEQAWVKTTPEDPDAHACSFSRAPGLT